MCTKQLVGLHYGLIVLVVSAVALAQAGPQTAPTQPTKQPAPAVTLEHAKFACPMESHPDESDPADRGPYFSTQPGECPRCGMTLKPVDELAWVQARKAAQGGAVAYSCPDHPHVFSHTPGKCPRCGHALEPFKLMYTCPNPEHASVVRAAPGECPLDHRKLTPFRGIWLSPEMAERNVPPNTAPSETATYRCPLHPLVHSDKPGDCTICARALEPAAEVAAAEPPKPEATAIPADAKYACPMEVCGYFASEPGRCPECGMRTQPIEQVSWAAALLKEQAANKPTGYVCPMHADRVHQAGPGTCPICGMQLVKAETLSKPASAPAAIAAQMNYLMEHYLALQQRFASDRTDDVPLHALGLVGAADEMIKHLAHAHLPAGVADAVHNLRTAALKLTGKNLDDDRVTFVAIGNAMRELVEAVRPSKEQYPEIYIFHCPMTKGDWLQTTNEMANPFYGFKMLKCGEPQAVLK